MQARPDRWLVLYEDASDPVASAVIGRAQRLGDVVAISLGQLLSEVAFGATWTWKGRAIDPARTAVVNRLTSLDGKSGNTGMTLFQKQLLWIWLRDELQRFAYASALPTPNSPVGGYGSLLDQWSDLPEQVAGLRVPLHRAPWSRTTLSGDVYLVDPRSLYSLGTPIGAGRGPPEATLAYVRPRGLLVHVSQVGRKFALANAPPGMTRAQHDYLSVFARTMATGSTSRILEHAFFVADETPVFFATSPIPLVTGGVSEYPDFVVHGLQDDLVSRSARAPS